MIFQITKFDHTTPSRIDLQWLPVVWFKLALFFFELLNNLSPPYVTVKLDLLSPKPAPNYALYSSMQPLISSSSQLLYTLEFLLSHGTRCRYRLGPVAASPFIEKQLKACLFRNSKLSDNKSHGNSNLYRHGPNHLIT